MADDGMLLNLNFSETVAAAPRATTALSGGRWTTRLNAKRATRNREQKKLGLKNQGTPQPQPQPSKPRDTATAKRHDKSQPELTLKRKRDHEQASRGPPPGANGTFVSSLWTSNPESTTAAEARIGGEERVEHKPSNAPILDGSSTFTTLGLSLALAGHLTTKLELKAPTNIQRIAIPQLLDGNSDAFIQAETGSGKTLTYLLPILDRVMRIPMPSDRGSGLYAVILAPTRELSRQIYTVMETLIHCKNGPHWIVPGQVTGGEKKKSEKARLRKGVNILVATPGRFLDHLQNTKKLDVGQVRWLILDEGDRLMELGFEEDIAKVLDILRTRGRITSEGPDDPLPQKRVTILCSATMKSNVQKLGEKSLQDALYIKAERDENDEEKTQFTAPVQLRQSYVVIPAKQRLVGLHAALKRAFARETANPKVIVFFSCTDSVDFHYETFARQQPKDPKWKSHERKVETRPDDQKSKTMAAVLPAPTLGPNVLVHKLHGSLAQTTRTATLASFTHAKNPAILFCTDVAARGLDLPNVDLVIQFDPPFSADDHLHRIGRTARAGREGRAIIFLLPGPEEGYVDAVLKQGIRHGQLVRADRNEVIRKGFGGSEKDDQREWEDAATEWQLTVERWVMEDQKVRDLAGRAWSSHVRAYMTHVGKEKVIFDPKGLHTGHLAKSFGLREIPSNIKAQIPATRGGGAKGGKQTLGKKRKPDEGGVGEVVGDEVVRKMQKMAKAMERKGGLSSEFNIG